MLLILNMYFSVLAYFYPHHSYLAVSTVTSGGLLPQIKNFFPHLILHPACLYILPSPALFGPEITPLHIHYTCLLFLTQHRLNMVGSCHQSKSTQKQQQIWYQPVPLPLPGWETPLQQARAVQSADRGRDGAGRVSGPHTVSPSSSFLFPSSAILKRSCHACIPWVCPYKA